MRNYSWLWARKAIAIMKCFCMIDLLDTSVSRFHLRKVCLGQNFSQPILWNSSEGKMVQRCDSAQRGALSFLTVSGFYYISQSSYYWSVRWKIILHWGYTDIVHHIFILTGIGQNVIILFDDKCRDFYSRVKPEEKICLKICLECCGGAGRKER